MSLNEYELTFLKQLIAIPSVGSDPEPGCPYGKESKRALDFFLSEAVSQGFDTGIIDDKVGYVQFGKGEKMIGIVCHLDVVPAGKGWESEPFELTIKDGCYYGRGIIDDKGPACASYFAMKRLKEEGFIPDARIRLILGSDEERTCDCVATYAAKGEIPDFSITPDAEFPVIYAEKGILQIRISGSSVGKITASAGNAVNMVPEEFTLTCNGITTVTQGLSAHAARPELGINAIFKGIGNASESDTDQSPLLRFIREKILGRGYSDYTGCSINDDSGMITANPSVLRIDEEQETLMIDIRYPVTANHNDIVSYIASEASPYGLSVKISEHKAPIYKDKDTKEIQILTDIWRNHISDYSGYKPEYKEQFVSPLAIGGGTYARYLPNTIAFGVQIPWLEDQCHQANEHIAVSDFDINIDLLADTIRKLS